MPAARVGSRAPRLPEASNRLLLPGSLAARDARGSFGLAWPRPTDTPPPIAAIAADGTTPKRSGARRGAIATSPRGCEREILFFGLETRTPTRIPGRPQMTINLLATKCRRLQANELRSRERKRSPYTGLYQKTHPRMTQSTAFPFRPTLAYRPTLNTPK